MIKVFRVFLLFVLLLGLPNSPAHAQSGRDAQVGYLVLAKNAQPGLTVISQSLEAYTQVSVLLDKAQRDGIIEKVEPILQQGLLKITFAPGFSAEALKTNWIILSSKSEALAQVNLRPVQTSQVSPELFSPWISMALGQDCFNADNLGNGSRLVASLRDKSGAIASVFQGVAGTDGFIWGCFDGDYPVNIILPGYKATFKVYSPANALLGTYSFVAPKINVTAINNAAAVVSGLATPNAGFDAYWEHPNLDQNQTKLEVYGSGTVSGTGAYAVDFGSIPFRGGDYYRVGITLSANFYAYREGRVPSMSCQMGRAICELWGIPLTPASISIKHLGVTRTYTGKFDHAGYFSAYLSDKDSNPLWLAAGDTVSGTKVAAWKLPLMTTGIDFASNVVKGKSAANKWLTVGVVSIDPYEGSFGWVKANASGVYSKNFSAWKDLKNTDALVAIAYTTNPVTGNTSSIFKNYGP